MFDYWKYKKWRRELQRQIADVDKKSIENVQRAEIGSVGEAVARDRATRRHLEMELEVLEAEHLRKKAARYGLYSLPSQTTYDPKIEGAAPRLYFLPNNKEQLYRMVADAKFDYWKRRVDFLSPIIATIISIIALIVSIIALNINSRFDFLLTN